LGWPDGASDRGPIRQAGGSLAHKYALTGFSEAAAPDRSADRAIGSQWIAQAA
jgi:hypothetical protein